MKTSVSWYTSCLWFAFLFVLGGIATVAAQRILMEKATAQQPAAQPAAAAPAFDGRAIVERRPDGTVVHRTADGKIIQTFTGRVAAAGAEHRHFDYGVAPDPETAKLWQEETAAAQETHKLTADYRTAESEGDKEKIKTQLREKLTAIFDLQQKRRGREIEQIQTRLKKLEETMTRRDGAKKDIVERRLEVLTGGIDELGWEDTLRYGPNAAAQRTPIGLPGPPYVTPPGSGVFPPTVPGPGVLPPPVPVPAGALPSPAAVDPSGATPSPTAPPRK